MVTPGRPPADTWRYAPPPKEADPIFRTEQYAVWRNAVCERAGFRCEWVDGGIPCGRSEQRMFADHIIERRDGGEPYDMANAQCLCGRHHTLKTNIEKRKRSERIDQFLRGAIQ
jgi:hypothetical protein